jgi:hypothetical protein
MWSAFQTYLLFLRASSSWLEFQAVQVVFSICWAELIYVSFLFFFFETRSYSAALAGLKLTILLPKPAGITVMCYYTLNQNYFFWEALGYLLLSLLVRTRTSPGA